ncbi:hypothetical protein HNR41_000986 [Jeotgalicoccus coquinae]|uniref:Uncharacterized protein n=1 Tax=Jeotgalicoccus coquinae TaxID=709509 RepID=A0ABR6QN60_9STAP|nr:hypothetical protein [Jeotgalicoccus coquinae]
MDLYFKGRVETQPAARFNQQLSLRSKQLIIPTSDHR